MPGSSGKRLTPRAWRDLDRRVRLRLGVAGGVLVTFAAFTACGGCGKRAPAGGDSTAAAHASASAPASDRALVAKDGGSLRDPVLWGHARSGEVEDLATLAAHEGAIGLVEATSEPDLRPTAIRAMAYADGWAQLPFLAKTASGKDDEEARVALEATLDLAARPRRSEDPEDADELERGCADLSALARETSHPRGRRVAAIRALRMMPCPKTSELPTDVDAK